MLRLKHLAVLDESQIVRNLLANAIKFTTMGSIHLTADVKDEWIEISVVDTGSGMIPSLAANLFRPYSSTGAAESGCGLGLWISAELARSFGGKLEVESTQGVGTRVALRLPLGRALPIL